MTGSAAGLDGTPRGPGFPVVGVVGGGQLARMMAQPAIALGIGLRVLATGPSESAAQVIGDVRIGRHDDLAALLAFAQGCDVVTFDHEHVPTEYLHELQSAGVAVRPGPEALIFAQDKLAMREALSAAGVPCPRWARIETRADAVAFGQRVGWPFILKTSRGGYDGKGVWQVDDVADADALLTSASLPSGAAWLGEEKVEFVSELSAQVARSPHGQAVAYQVVRTVQRDGICSEVIAPAPGVSAARVAEAQHIALSVAGSLGVVGMLAVELFDTGDRLLVNELAMRPHNSGHWSIEGADTSQFENHLRAVLDLPLGSPSPRSPAAVMVNILGGDHPDLYRAYLHVMARDPGIKVHLYGKEVRPGRKVGHVTALGDDVAVLAERARHAADFFTGVIDG